MNWFEAKISTTSGAIDNVTGILLGLGITGFLIEDNADFEEYLNSEKNPSIYIDDEFIASQNKETAVTVFLPENEQGKNTLIAMREEFIRVKNDCPEFDFGSLEISLNNVAEESWADNWKKYFKPFKIGKKLLIKPSWEEVENEENREILNIDPGSSFGTGRHHTTKLCLEQLENVIKGGEKVFDIGCGSGILSIACLLLGAKSAVGVDIDENSVRIALENSEINNIDGEKFTAYWGNILDDEELCEKIGNDYDVIAANIVADIIIAMAPLFRRFMKPNALLVTSGIIYRQVDEVKEALKQNEFEILEEHQENDWYCLISK